MPLVTQRDSNKVEPQQMYCPGYTTQAKLAMNHGDVFSLKSAHISAKYYRVWKNHPRGQKLNK